jgi:putative IMPACT (imprinted ancient) family translation regulator
VVVRYYGGINLGMGGLARAYSQAGLRAILASKLNNFIELFEYIFIIKYNYLDIISKVILDNNGMIIDRKFDQNITLKVKVSDATREIIKNKFPMIEINSLA